MQLYRVVCSCTELCAVRVVQSCVQCELYRVVQSCTELYRGVCSCTELYRVVCCCTELCAVRRVVEGCATTLCTDLLSATSAFWHFYNQCEFNSFRQVIWLECKSKVSLYQIVQPTHTELCATTLHIRMHVYSHTRARTKLHIHIRMHVYSHTHEHAQSHTHLHPDAKSHTHINTYIHTRTHTCTHTHTCLSTRSAFVPVSSTGSVERATKAGMASQGAVSPPLWATSISSSTRL